MSKPQSSIHHSISDYLYALSEWELTPLRVIGNNKYIFKNNNWEEVEVYELRPTYNRPPLSNPDGTSIPSEVYRPKS